MLLYATLLVTFTIKGKLYVSTTNVYEGSYQKIVPVRSVVTVVEINNLLTRYETNPPVMSRY